MMRRLKKLKKFIKVRKVSVVTSLIVVFMGIVGMFIFTLVNNNFEKRVSEKNYVLKYDKSWKIEKMDSESVTLKHKGSKSLLKIEMVSLAMEYQYSTIEELIDEVLYNIERENKEYKLISKIEDNFTKNKYKGYKMLYENNNRQVMVATYKKSDKLIIITYEADDSYFDILLDSVHNIIYNFDYVDEKFALGSEIKLSISSVDYSRNQKVEELLSKTKNYEIASDNYEVEYSIPDNFKLGALNTRNNNFDFEGVSNGSIRLNTFILNRNIYEYLDEDSKLGLYSGYNVYRRDEKYKSFKEDITKLKSNYKAYIYKNSYKKDKDVYENIELVYALNKNHVFVVKITSSKVGIPEKLVNLVKIKRSKNYASYVKGVKSDNYLVGELKRFNDYKKEKIDNITIKLPDKYEEYDKDNNLYEERYYGVNYSSSKEIYDYDVRYRLTSNYIDDIDRQVEIINGMFKTAYGRCDELTRSGEFTVNNKKVVVYDGGYTDLGGIMFTDINRYEYYVTKKALFYEVASGGYLIIEISGNGVDITDEIVNEVSNFSVDVLDY